MRRKPTLTQLYNYGIDVRDSLIPDKWKESFNRFMMGQPVIKQRILIPVKWNSAIIQLILEGGIIKMKKPS